MSRHGTQTRATSLLLMAAGAAAGFALYMAIRPKRVRPSPRLSAHRERNAPLLLEPPPTLPPDELIERRVLEVFRNDPIISQRAIDICAIEDGGVELTGWVNIAAEVGYAVTLARGVPGVSQVIDHLAVRGPVPIRNHSSGNYAAIDPAVAIGHAPRAD